MSKSTRKSQQARVASFFLSAALATATLWDFRLFDLRLFDGVALCCLGAYFMLAPEARTGFMLRRRNYWLLFATIISYAALGYILHSHRSSLAIIALAIVGFVLVGRRDWLDSHASLLWPLAFIHVLLFFIQFGAFYGFHHVIDYQAALGGASRIMRAPEHMRAAGLFQEPNSYCLNLFVLVSMAILARPSRPLTLTAALTMFLSESFWGIGASIVLLFLNEMRLQQSPRRLVIAFSASLAIVAIFFNAYLWLGKNRDESIPYSYGRVVDILTDPSLRERYLHNTCSINKQVDTASAPPMTRIAQWTFGEGLTTQYFIECLPVNGIAFLFKSLGAVGFIVLLAGFALALRGLSTGAKLYAALAIGFSFTSYPLVTYVVFWIWLPAIVGLLRFKNAEPAPEISLTARDGSPTAR